MTILKSILAGGYSECHFKDWCILSDDKLASLHVAKYKNCKQLSWHWGVMIDDSVKSWSLGGK